MWQISGDKNFHFAYMWQAVTGKNYFEGTYSAVRGYNSADHLPHIIGILAHLLPYIDQM